jgi:Phage integrase family
MDCCIWTGWQSTEHFPRAQHCRSRDWQDCPLLKSFRLGSQLVFPTHGASGRDYRTASQRTVRPEVEGRRFLKARVECGTFCLSPHRRKLQHRRLAKTFHWTLIWPPTSGGGRKRLGTRNPTGRYSPANTRRGISLLARHTFRHSYSSLLVANGDNVKVVQELMRHASSRFTLDVYSQARRGAKRHAQQRVVQRILP